VIVINEINASLGQMGSESNTESAKASLIKKMELAEKLNEKLFMAFTSDNAFKFHDITIGIGLKVSGFVRTTSNKIKDSGNMPFKWEEKDTLELEANLNKVKSLSCFDEFI